MVDDWFSFQEESSSASCAPCSHMLWENSLTICFFQCFILGRADEYSCTTRAFQPMTPFIPSKDTIVALRQVHPSFRPYPSTYF